MNSALVHFHEIRAKRSDLKGISSDELAIYGALSFIVNELNVFSKLLLAATSVESKQRPVALASDVQHNTLLRTFASKVFEAHEFLKKIPSEGFEVDERVMSLVKETAKEIEDLASEDGFSINRNMRNEVAFHYVWKTARKHAQEAPDDLGVSIFINRLDGNTYFEIGEQLMYIQRLRRFALANKKYEEIETLAEAWLGWVKRAFRAIRRLHIAVVEIIVDQHHNNAADKRHYFIDPRLIAEKGEFVLPVFYRGSDS